VVFLVPGKPAPLDMIEWMTEIDTLNAPIGWVSREDVRKACERRKAALDQGFLLARVPTGTDARACSREMTAIEHD
jgi:hypothetical protein